MRLTVYSDYAFRVLIYLALDTGRRVTIRDIADAYGISRNHLMKVVNGLTRANLVIASRGVKGGLSLAKPADEISLGEVIRGTEEDFALVECFRPDNACVISPVCSLKGIFKEASFAFLDVLDQHTVADLVRKRTPLKRHLEMD